jgi:hypothetical protein
MAHDVFSVYLRAKAEADHALIDSGSARVRIAAEPLRGKVPRDDVAAVLAAIVHEPRSVEHILYVASGDHPIEEALAAALAA